MVESAVHIPDWGSLASTPHRFPRTHALVASPVPTRRSLRHPQVKVTKKIKFERTRRAKSKRILEQKYQELKVKDQRLQQEEEALTETTYETNRDKLAP